MHAPLALLILAGLAHGAAADEVGAQTRAGQIRGGQQWVDRDRGGQARLGEDGGSRPGSPGNAGARQTRGSVDIHVGNHSNFGRVVLTLPASVATAEPPLARREGDSLIVDLPGAGLVTAAAHLSAPHVLGVQGGQDHAVLMLQRGSTTRVWRMGPRIVVDVFAGDAKGSDAEAANGQTRAGQAGAKAGGPGGAPPGAPIADAPDLAATRGVPALATAPRGTVAERAAQGLAPSRLPGGLARSNPPAPSRTASSPNSIALPAGPPVPAAHPFTLAAPVSPVAAPPPSRAAAGPVPRSAEPQPPPMEAASANEDSPQAAAAPIESSEALRAVRLPGPGDTILLPFDSKVGAAAFGAGGMGHAVFDDSKAIDLAALKDDPVFGSARILVAPGSTHLRMSVPEGARLSLARQAEGWALSVLATQADRRAAPVRLHGATLSIAMKQAATVVVLLDPQTGAKLLVGTVHGHGEGVIIGHASAEFRLLPSWEGVAVQVVSDRLALGATREGFALSASSGPALSTLMPDDAQAALESAGTLTRRFDIPPLSLPAMRQRLLADIAAAGHAPRQARFAPRLAAAKDMLGLGMDREAAALLGAARNDDPAQEARPDAVALLAIARWLAGLSETSGAPAGPGLGAIDNPALGGSDEIALWRALLPPRDGGEGAAAARAAVLAADWRLLASYPAPLRARLVGQAAGVMIDGNALGAAGELLAANADLPLGLERARLLAAGGHVAEALAALDRLTRGVDRRQAAFALRDATELRLGSHLMTPRAAASALDKQLYAWRDPDFEMARRLRIAALQTQSGDFRSALTGLRETGSLFPQAHERVATGEAAAIGALVRTGAAGLAPLDLVSLVEDNADLLGQGDVAASLTPVLVDKLVALDLPDRADRLVVKLIGSTSEPLPKAMLGARLAGLRLDQNDAPGALAALDQTMGEALPPELEQRRAVVRARALAQMGEDGPALSLLAGREGVESWQMQAQLREKSHDWRGADAALQKLVQAGVPASGALTEAQQDLVLRLASVASQAGDTATLHVLAEGAARRLSPGPRRSLFEALTVQPVRELSDLPRAQREATDAAALPAAWARYAGH